MSARRFIATIGFLFGLAGCASGPRYACGLPEGIRCQPVSEVYAASLAPAPAPIGSVPDASYRALSPTPAGETSGARPATRARPIVATVKPGDPLLTAPRVLRLWIAPWEDVAGDLHDETYLYLRLDDGRWTRPR